MQAEELDRNSQAILDSVSARVLQGVDASRVSVVDVGAGEGRLLRCLQGRGVQTLAGIGWDACIPESALVFNRIDLSQPRWSERLEGRRFDWVVSTEVLEHLVNPFQFLVELRSIVAENGHLLLTFPNVHNWRSIIGYAVAGRYSGFFGPNFNNNHPLHDQHIFIPNLHLVRYFLRLAGFSIAETHWVNGGLKLTAQTTLLVATPSEPVRLT
jgi:2-polyprenyl-3-methyl-5-hydroxy-6-metoxy-1,4-benzoquinol methylase